MQRLALLGAIEGPHVDISRIKRPILQVRGLPEGGLLYVRYDPDTVVAIRQDGDYMVDWPVTWVRISYVAGPQKHKTICSFVSSKAA